jgi:hypothetical protein
VPSEDIQRLRDEIARWRAELDETFIGPERRALQVAIKALDLCIDRGVVPRLDGPFSNYTELVIPRRVYNSISVQASRHAHGPVAVECELYCPTTHAALDLVHDALRASEHVEGWAPLFVSRWVELLRRECELALQTPVAKHGPRLVVAPEQDPDA